MLITSPANERLKHARRVRDGREDDFIFIEGERLIEECLQSGLQLVACFHFPEVSTRAQLILAELAQRDCTLLPTADAVLATISDTVHSQGLILLAKRPIVTIEQVMDSGELIVCLDSIQDPGNFGTILRTAEAAGANGVISLKGSVDAFAPKTLRSAMGSAFRLPIANNVSPEDLLSAYDAKAFTLVATATDGEIVYNQFDWQQPVIVVFGNEANGVRPDLLPLCDARLRIPLHPPVESLNVAAAAAILLFDAANRKKRN